MEQVKQNKTLYWIAKGFISFFMLLAAFFSYVNVEGLRKLGFPDYFRYELITAKIIGAILLLLPFTQVRMKEWIYAGFIITMVSALIAHISSGDPLSQIIFVSVDFVLVLLSIRYVSNKDLAQRQITSTTQS
jgi:putative oxidoreductase